MNIQILMTFLGEGVSEGVGTSHELGEIGEISGQIFLTRGNKLFSAPMPLNPKFGKKNVKTTEIL